MIPNFNSLKRLIHPQNQTWNRRLRFFGKILIRFLFSDYMYLNSQRNKNPTMDSLAWQQCGEKLAEVVFPQEDHLADIPFLDRLPKERKDYKS